ARPVWQPMPDGVRAELHAPMPNAANDLAAVHDEFMRLILPYATGNVHPGFMGWVHGGGNPAGMLAEMLAAGLNANLGGRDHAPLGGDRRIGRWIADLFGSPATAAALFVPAPSMPIFIAVLVARTAALGVGVRRRGVAAYKKRLTAYVSAAAHGCIPQAMD